MAATWLDNRELGIINIGGEGTVTVDGKKYDMGFQDALYVGRGAKDIVLSSKNAAQPAKFYLNSTCAQASYPTKKVTMKEANNIKARLHGGQQRPRDTPDAHRRCGRSAHLSAANGHHRA